MHAQCIYDARQWKHKQIGLTHTKKYEHSEWTQWHEAKSDLHQTHELLNTTSKLKKQFWQYSLLLLWN